MRYLAEMRPGSCTQHYHMMKTYSAAKLLLVLLLGSVLHTDARAQDKTKDGYRLSWDHHLSVQQDSMALRTGQLPAWTITVHESSARDVLKLWRSDIAPTAERVSGSGPTLARSATLKGLANGPYDIRAMSSQDRRAGSATLSLAFSKGDSTIGHNTEGVAEAIYQVAVRLNKAVVQEQLAALQKDFDKAKSKQERAQKNESKLSRQLTKANRDLERVKTRKSRAQRGGAGARGDISGLERKFALTNDPTDLKRLTKARNSLVKEEQRMAKMMRDEARAQGRVNKIQKADARSAGDATGAEFLHGRTTTRDRCPAQEAGCHTMRKPRQVPNDPFDRSGQFAPVFSLFGLAGSEEREFHPWPDQ